MFPCPCCSRHVRGSERCPFCALLLAAVCAAAVASCGGGDRVAAAVYGAPPEPVGAHWTATLEQDVEGYVGAFVTAATTHGCTVRIRATDEASLGCPEGNISIAKKQLEISIACDDLPERRCRALFRAIADTH